MRNLSVQRGLSYKIQVMVLQMTQIKTNYNNLDCGDLGSLGSFQQWSSQGWCLCGDIFNIEHSMNAFIGAALACNDKHLS